MHKPSPHIPAPARRIESARSSRFGKVIERLECGHVIVWDCDVAPPPPGYFRDCPECLRADSGAVQDGH